MSRMGNPLRHLILRIGLATVIGSTFVPALANAGQDELAPVRAATAQFHDLDAAIAAGYELGYVNGNGVRIITGCIKHPTAGAIYHFRPGVRGLPAPTFAG